MLALFKLPAQLGYFLLFTLVGAESSGVPLPGESALIGAGILAHDGRLQIALVVAVAIVAAIIGDNIGYLIGRTAGRRLLERPGFMQAHRRRILEQSEPFFAKHGPKAVFVGRWIAGLRIAAAWLAGINRMPWKVFLFWNTLGAVAWATTIGLLAYELGPVVEEAFRYVGASGFALALLAGAGYLVVRRSRHPAEQRGARLQPSQSRAR